MGEAWQEGKTKTQHKSVRGGTCSLLLAVPFLANTLRLRAALRKHKRTEDNENIRCLRSRAS